MKITTIYFFAILSTIISVTKELYSQSPVSLWTQVIGGDSVDVGYDVEELWDGGFAVVGYTKSISLTNYDVLLLRTDSNGDTLWTKTYGGSEDDFGYSIKLAEDGGFIIGGVTNSFGSGGSDFYLIKTDSLGSVNWTKTFGGVNNDVGWSVEKTTDGGYIVVGERNDFPETSDGWAVKTNSLGQMEWQKIYGTANSDRVFSIKQTIDGGYIIAGLYDCGFAGNGLCTSWLIKIDAFGDTLWTRNYGGDTAGWFNSVDLTLDGGYILSGPYIPSPGSYPDVWLLRTDSLGNQIFSRNYDFDNDIDLGYSVQKTFDGGFVIAGIAHYADVSEDIWIIKSDSLGDTTWTKFINFSKKKSFSPSGFMSNNNAFSVKQTSDGGYIVTGFVSVNVPSSFDNIQLYLLRLAPDIIPVELTSFTATVTRNSVSLNWQTATETNNSGFEMQRSQMSNVNGQTDWQVIGFIPGSGTTTEPKSYSFIDENLSAGNYQYRLKQIDFDGSFEYSKTIGVEITSPTEFTLEQNYPNPFNPSTVISYSLPQKEFVTIKVIDILGREVATLVNEVKPTGKYEVEFDASSLSSGVYVYQINAGSFTTSKKMLLTK